MRILSLDELSNVKINKKGIRHPREQDQKMNRRERDDNTVRHSKLQKHKSGRVAQ